MTDSRCLMDTAALICLHTSEWRWLVNAAVPSFPVCNRSTRKVAQKLTSFSRLLKGLLKQQCYVCHPSKKKQPRRSFRTHSILLVFSFTFVSIFLEWRHTGIRTPIKYGEMSQPVGVLLQPIIYINPRCRTLLFLGPSRHRLS